MCGIVGVVDGRGRVFGALANGAHFLQHRGPAYAGIFVVDPATRQVRLEKGAGLADDVFKALDELPGDLGIAHTRYRTFGDGGAENAQPVYHAFANVALAHNGHITNVTQIADELATRGERLATENDAEPLLRVLTAWIERYRGRDPRLPERAHVFSAIREVQERITGAYSAVVATAEALYAFRDPHGFRPLVYGQREDRFMVASETLALEQNGFRDIRELARGGALAVGRDLALETRILLEKEPLPCAFETIYFADVESRMLGETNRSHRWRAGLALAAFVAQEAPEVLDGIDLVVPIPHSPIPGAEAFAQWLETQGRAVELSKAQYTQPVSKYRYGGRIFLEETQEARDDAAQRDFRIDDRIVEGKRIFLVDDSIVRGTNARRVVAQLRQAGADKVYLGTLWPMVVDSCYQGINTPTQRELIGARFNRDVENIRGELGLDGLFYLPTGTFQEEVLKGRPACMACVTGRRAVPFAYAGDVLPRAPAS